MSESGFRQTLSNFGPLVYEYWGALDAGSSYMTTELQSVAAAAQHTVVAIVLRDILDQGTYYLLTAPDDPEVTR